MSTDIYLVYRCDEWKSRASMRLVMATTNFRRLRQCLVHEIESAEMDYKGESGDEAARAFAIEGYNDALLAYGYVDKVPNGVTC